PPSPTLFPYTTLFRSPATQQVWMSHGDSVWSAPAGFVVTAESDGAHVAAFEDLARGLVGVQFHPEVVHSPHGMKVLEHFLYDVRSEEHTSELQSLAYL